MKLYCVVVYVTSSYIYGRPNRSAAEEFRDIIYSVECELFVDVCLCYHNSNDTYYVRIKNDGIRPLRTYASQLDFYTPGSMQLDGGDLSKMHRVEWGKTHTFWKVGSVSQSSADNYLIPFPSGTSNICLQSIGETAP